MTMYEIMALIMRKKSRFEGDAFAVAATCIESLAHRLNQDEPEQLISTGGAIYCMEADDCKQEVPLENLFPAWKIGRLPIPHATGFAMMVRRLLIDTSFTLDTSMLRFARL